MAKLVRYEALILVLEALPTTDVLEQLSDGSMPKPAHTPNACSVLVLLPYGFVFRTYAITEICSDLR